MQSELEQRLYNISKKHLIQLVQELVARHPVLLEEMEHMLISFPLENAPEGPSLQHAVEEADDEIIDDWDFSGDEPVTLRPFPHGRSAPLKSEDHQQLIEIYAARLRQQDTPQGLLAALSDVAEEAFTRIGHTDYAGALDLYALIFDERPREQTSSLAATFDELIDATLPSLDSLLASVSSNTLFDSSSTMRAPLLPSHARQQWLERLFTLWLRHLDAHTDENDLPEVMRDVAWNEDIQLLRDLAQNELQKQPRNPHSNIVDFTRQYRTRALEKFLKELPRT